MKKNVSPKKLVLKGYQIRLIKDKIIDLVRQDSIGDVEYSLVFGELEIEFWATNITYDNILSELSVYDLSIVEEHVEVPVEVIPDVQEPPVKAFQVTKDYYVLAYTEREAIDFWYKMETPTTAEIEEAMRGGYGEVSPDRVIKTTWGREATIRDLINDFVELKITFPGSLRDYSHGRQ